MYIKKIHTKYPKIDTSQMIEVDRLMMEEYHIGLIQMMENAGRNLAIVAREEFLDSDPEFKRICVLAGTGGNGGGAMVCARRLKTWGADVKIYLTAEEDRLKPIPSHQYKILRQMGVEFGHIDELQNETEFDVIIDGILGYSVNGNPYGSSRVMINWANKINTKVLSLDTPSGLDLSSGTTYEPTIIADATLTLAMPKQGLFSINAKTKVGQLFLGDISVPPSLYSEPSLSIKTENIFRFSDIIKIPI